MRNSLHQAGHWHWHQHQYDSSIFLSHAGFLFCLEIFSCYAFRFVSTSWFVLSWLILFIVNRKGYLQTIMVCIIIQFTIVLSHSRICSNLMCYSPNSWEICFQVRNHDENLLSDMLPIYYTRLFPQNIFCRWLACGSAPQPLSNRELSFTLADDVYLRYLTICHQKDLQTLLQKKCPYKLDVGAVYNTK